MQPGHPTTEMVRRLGAGGHERQHPRAATSVRKERVYAGCALRVSVERAADSPPGAGGGARSNVSSNVSELTSSWFGRTSRPRGAWFSSCALVIRGCWFRFLSATGGEADFVSWRCGCERLAADPTGENEPTPDERLPPGETRTKGRRTTARTPELHRQRHTLEVKRCNPALPPLPTNADQGLPTPSGPATL